MKIDVLCHWSSKNLKEAFLYGCALHFHNFLCMFQKLLCFNCKDFEADLFLLLFAVSSKIVSKEAYQSKEIGQSLCRYY